MTQAEGGNLYQVCPRCFHLGELRAHLVTLDRSDDVRRTVEEGLETLYLTVKNRLEELSDASQCPKEAEMKKRATKSPNTLVRRRCRSLALSHPFFCSW